MTPEEKLNSYNAFLESKIKFAEKTGISIDATLLHPSTKPHQRDIIIWACERGAALIAADCGMGKTHIAIEVQRMIHKHFNYQGKHLIVTELGASETFINEDPEIGEGARLGVKLEYVTNQMQAFASECDIVVTNYERVRNGEFNFSFFTSVWLDEGNYVKNMASETTSMLQQQLAKVKFKFIASATPNPNRTLELVNYAHVLGICDRGQILTRFFQRNSTKAGDLTLHPHHEEDFWMWVYSWMVSIQKPSDMGYEDEGYELPELIINWHEIKLDKEIETKFDRDGQKKMFLDVDADLGDKARLKRESINGRISKAMEIVAQNPQDHHLLWHLLEDERREIGKAFKGHPSYGEIYGSQDWDLREANTVAFSKGQLMHLGTKAELNGVGCNFQKHCHRNIVTSINHDFDALYQLIKRTHRYGQTHPVTVDIIFVSDEHTIVSDLKEKWKLHIEQREKLSLIVRKYGLSHSKFIEAKRRSFHINSKTYSGENYTLIEGDCVHVWQGIESNSIKLINTSFPFGNHYEYTDKYNDFGHNQDLDQFAHQLSFLIPELLRTLEPGRICAVHLKNRIHYGSVTGKGFSIFHRFTHRMCDEMERHGFETMGFHYIPTDVVAENNQTYRLTFGEMRKDSTKMGSGIPEEIWIFRKPPTSNSNAYADVPVTHSEEEFPLAQWQIDADAFWGSSGDRLLTPSEMKRFGLDKVHAWWKKFKKETIYDYEAHIKLLQELDEADKLSRTFTTLPMQSNSEFIWNDVNRMHGLNLEQSRRREQNHICPQPKDEAKRIINLYSNPGDLVADPFNGLGTTGVCALELGRTYIGSELSTIYAKNAAFYLRQTEMKKNIPTLFDLIAS